MNNKHNQHNLTVMEDILPNDRKVFSPNNRGTFTKTDPILGHKINLKKFRRAEIIQSMFFGYNEVKL